MFNEFSQNFWYTVPNFRASNEEEILMVIFTFRTPMTTGFIFLNFDLRHQNGISITELQTSLPTKRP